MNPMMMQGMPPAVPMNSESDIMAALGLAPPPQPGGGMGGMPGGMGGMGSEEDQLLQLLAMLSQGKQPGSVLPPELMAQLMGGGQGGPPMGGPPQPGY